jgi:hypothetical protein
MSIKVMERVWEHSKASGTPLLVLLCLADWANDAAECWPSISTIARKCRLKDDRHVQRVIHNHLEKRLGEVVVIVGGGMASRKGGVRSNRYRITVHMPADDESKTVAERPPSVVTDGGSGTTPTVADGPPLTVADGPPEPSVDPPPNRQETREDLEKEFESVWERYPRKVDRVRALRTYIARRRSGHSAADLLAASTNYAKGTTGIEPRFVKHCATFFGPDEPFADWVTESPDRPSAQPAVDPISRNRETIDGVLERIGPKRVELTR